MKFLCDQMLGTLATWLRLIGIDTYYAEAETSDKEVLKVAKQEGRILLTRDKELVRRAKKENIDTIEIISTNLDEQLQKVIKNTHIKMNDILSRCSICNSPIHQISKEKIKDKVPPKVLQYNEQFWYCPNCNKIYWKGSHWRKIQDKVEQLKSISCEKKS